MTVTRRRWWSQCKAEKKAGVTTARLMFCNNDGLSEWVEPRPTESNIRKREPAHCLKRRLIIAILISKHYHVCSGYKWKVNYDINIIMFLIFLSWALPSLCFCNNTVVTITTSVFLRWHAYASTCAAIEVLLELILVQTDFLLFRCIATGSKGDGETKIKMV